MPHPLTPLGYHPFDQLQAEHEGDWSKDAFVEPLDFNEMAGMRSIIVFGESGSGKTALRLALARQAYREDFPRQLRVDWFPSLPTGEQTGTPSVQACLTQVLDACVVALVRHLGSHPETFTAATEWVRETIVWFVHEYLLGDRPLRLSRLEEECAPPGVALLRELNSHPPRPILHSGVGEAMVIAELASVVRRLELAGLWVFIDGLEPWAEAEAESLTQFFKAFLSTLTLFEQPGFTLKVMMPLELEPMLNASGAITRRRLDTYKLEWPDEKLISIVERRLAVACGRSEFRLAELYPAAELIKWLKNYGGHSPRGWLNLIRPLTEVYLNRSKRRPLSKEEWKDIRLRHIPRLRVDLRTGQVLIGYTDMTGKLQPAAYRALLYLYKNKSRLCTRSELYYRVYRELDHEPHSHDDVIWESPKQWGGAIDTILWRLRRSIEPEPDRPVYIISDRGNGLRLENTE